LISRSISQFSTNTIFVEGNLYSREADAFPLVYELWIAEGLGPEGATHEIMAKQYRETLKRFMREIDISLNGTAVNQNLYSDLFWIGLESTQAYEGALNTQEIAEDDFLSIKFLELNKGKCE